MIQNLSERLKKLRNQANLSQREVANTLGVSPSIISAYETGERTPSLEKLLDFSYLYKCSTDYLLGKSQEAPSSVVDVDGLSDSQIKAVQIVIREFKTK